MSESQGKTKRAGSLVGSVASVDSKGKARSYPLWPEFNENDINSEKWEGAAKSKEKGKSPNLQFFDDPEGKIELPTSLKVDHWKRPQDFITSKLPVVVDNENYIDLMHANEHLCHSQFMRTIISQIMALWNLTRSKPPSRLDIAAENTTWLPWDHVYSLCKAGKGHMPLHNQFGKYIVRLFWMGCWRKIVVDDLMPYDVDEKLLLPASTIDHELWPLLLSKALIKIASIDYNLSGDVPEVGDYFVIQCLTGWIPETIPLQFSHNNNVWELVKKILPEWKLPEDKPAEIENKTSGVAASSPKVSEIPKHDNVGSASQKSEKAPGGKETKSSKDSTKKRDDKEKNKSVVEEPPPVRPEDVEMVVFATFNQSHDSPVPMSVLREMASSSERLRKIGISHLHTHPVLISQTRSCPLTPPVPVPEIPRWKLIRPRKKKVPPFDEPQPEPEPPKPHQWLELISPFIGYRPPPTQVPQDSVSTAPHSRTGSVTFSEADEERNSTSDKETKEKSKSRSKKHSDTAQQQGSRRTSVGRESPLVSPHTPTAKETENAESEVVNKPGETEEEEHVDGEEEILIGEAEVTEVMKKTWVEFDEFCKSFTNVVIFHKPNTYPHNESTGEFKQPALSAGLNPSNVSGSSKKGSANQTASSTNVVKPSTSPVVPRSYEGYPAEERTPSFLFVDSLKQTDLIVGFSVLPRWLGIEEKRSSDKESVAGASEVVSTKQEAPPLPSGLLVAEPYSWKSLVTGQPVLRIRTTGTKAACLSLPPGRHVLRFIFNSPLGYHVHICSATKFVFGDEDTVMAPLQEESCRFVETANNIMASIEKCFETFDNEAEWQNASAELRRAHMPYPPDSAEVLKSHLAAWHKAFYSMVSDALGDNKVQGLEFALRAFLLDFGPSQTLNHIPVGYRDSPESWNERVPNDMESSAAEVLQKCWRGMYTRKIIRAYTETASPEHVNAQESLRLVRAAVQQHPQSHALILLRKMLKANPNITTKFSFYKDEWNRICYTDYQGTYTEQPPRTWFIVFREVFFVEEDTLCVPKIHVPIATCMLRVVNNDTGEEVKRVFQKVAPYVYKRNKRGYTFVAEARTLDHALAAGKWRMRLIGSMNSLPIPINSQLVSQFTSKEIRDYYVPNKNNVLLRYTIKPQINMVGSLQLETSRPDAIIQFKILDNDTELVSRKGKGHCVIPAFYFLTNNRERSTSRASLGDSKPAPPPPPPVQLIKPPTATSNKKQAGGSSAKKSEEKAPPKEGRVDFNEQYVFPPIIEDTESTEPHNYFILATVEQKSWPLTRGQWSYVEKLKEVEREEMKIFTASKERSNSPGGQRQSVAKAGGAVDKSKKGGKGVPEKGGKEKKQSDKESGSRPSSQVNIFDDSRAFWTLRIITDHEQSEELEVKKDTQRLEDIRALKQAWEAAEPGRAIKAMQSRLAYLNNNLLKTESSDKENDEEDEKIIELAEHSPDLVDENELLSSPPPPPPTQKDLLKPFDYTPYIKMLPSEVAPRYISPEDLSAIEEEEQKAKVLEHNEKRARSIAFREQNRADRMVLKEQQLEIFQEMQYTLDKARTELLKPREEYRRKLLEEKRLKDEAAEAAAAVALSESQPVSPDVKGKKSAKSAKKKK